jgi:hypothetical protein
MTPSEAEADPPVVMKYTFETSGLASATLALYVFPL